MAICSPAQPPSWLARVFLANMAWTGPVKSGDDWMPGTPDGRIHLAKIWAAFTEDRGVALGMTAAEQTAFLAAITASDTANQAFIAINSDANREAAQEADALLQETMRFIKNHYFIYPKVTKLELVSLHLNSERAKSKRIPKPVNQAGITKFTPLGDHLLMMHLKIMGTLPVGYLTRWFHFRVHFAVVSDPSLAAVAPEAGGAIWRSIPKTPISGADLPNVADTHLKRLTLDFAEADRGKVVWFCVRLVNDKGEDGGWGPLYYTIVP
jgi:hypothetical protein